MSLSLKQFSALDYCLDFFHKKIKGIQIDCAVLYGSATYPGCFIENMSDLDILIFSKDAMLPNFTAIVEEISRAGQGEIAQKPPIILRDHIGDRIEFDLFYEGISIDCTIMSTLMLKRENILSNIVRDSTELLIGSILIWGKPVAGQIGECVTSDINLFPYYDESIRYERLTAIGQYLDPKIDRIKFMLNQKDVAVIDYFFRYRPVFLKWIFCYYKQYPVNFYKHLPMQLKWITQLSSVEISTIMLNSGMAVDENIRNFINFYSVKFSEFSD